MKLARYRGAKGKRWAPRSAKIHDRSDQACSKMKFEGRKVVGFLRKSKVTLKIMINKMILLLVLK